MVKESMQLCKKNSEEETHDNSLTACLPGFHYMFVHIWVTEWPPFGKELLTRLTICSLCILTVCNFGYLQVCFRWQSLGSDCFSS